MRQSLCRRNNNEEQRKWTVHWRGSMQLPTRLTTRALSDPDQSSKSKVITTTHTVSPAYLSQYRPRIEHSLYASYASYHIRSEHPFLPLEGCYKRTRSTFTRRSNWARQLQNICRELSACTGCPCNSSFGQLRLSDGTGSKFHICNFDLGFSKNCVKCRNSHNLKKIGVLLLVLSRHKLSCEQFSSPLLLTTFTTHLFSIDWYMMMA